MIFGVFVAIMITLRVRYVKTLILMTVVITTDVPIMRLTIPVRYMGGFTVLPTLLLLAQLNRAGGRDRTKARCTDRRFVLDQRTLFRPRIDQRAESNRRQQCSCRDPTCRSGQLRRDRVARDVNRPGNCTKALYYTARDQRQLRWQRIRQRDHGASSNRSASNNAGNQIIRDHAVMTHPVLVQAQGRDTTGSTATGRTRHLQGVRHRHRQERHRSTSRGQRTDRRLILDQRTRSHTRCELRHDRDHRQGRWCCYRTGGRNRRGKQIATDRKRRKGETSDGSRGNSDW